MSASAVPLTTAALPRRGWRARACARLGGLCDLLRAAHHARIPF